METATINPRATVEETAAALRQALRAGFPGVGFSVRRSTGTAYGSIDVAYTGDLDQRTVQRATDRFVSSRFDPMDNSYRSTGVSTWSCRGVLVHQRAA